MCCLYNRKKVNNAGLEYYYYVVRDEHGCRGCAYLNPATNHFTVKNGYVNPMMSNQDDEVMIFKVGFIDNFIFYEKR
uniref:Uncharacterized protein n=1 Tax=Acrobeloides nanus TaxID=290746 RepID=A0A914E4P4_9BILA